MYENVEKCGNKAKNKKPIRTRITRKRARKRKDDKEWIQEEDGRTDNCVQRQADNTELQ